MGSRAGFARSAQTRWPSVTTQPGSHHRVPSWFMSPPSHRRRPRLSPASRGGVPSSSSLPCPRSWLYGNAFLDQNANGVYDEPSELGAVLAEQGATGTALAAAEGTPVDSDLTKEYADEFSASVEHELAVDTSLRVSWFYRRFD